MKLHFDSDEAVKSKCDSNHSNAIITKNDEHDQNDVELGVLDNNDGGNVEVAMKNNTSTSLNNNDNICAICLDEFQVNDAISWSKNGNCNHVFHNKCIADWFLLYNKKRCNNNRSNVCSSFSFSCPICRCEYVTIPSTITVNHRHRSSIDNDNTTSVSVDSSNDNSRNEDNLTARECFTYCVSRGLISSSSPQQ